ncbi:ABC transporter permease [Colwellia sp. 75C3]|uniref:ABC transporter permease n=1 Tax=Colwellia sp. 75C3 TaxID=888425 RepID=UPI000C3312FD|nr:ABC transporter permease [Colwellia sp. 75C3]PKG82887.1 ABC transporter permease [Colwellia sp. 75C3]
MTPFLSVLNKKLFRDLLNIKGQVAAITLVMAAGIAIFIIMFGVLDSLKLTRDTYYDRYQFADVFASLKRAPEAVKDRISEIPGVSVAQSRVVFGVTLQMESMLEPATGRIISLPDSSPSLLNKLYLREGRMLFPNEENAILADESFVKAHDLSLGDNLTVIMNGYKRTLHIVGIVLSPEYVYSIAPGALMPDSKRFGVFWMSRRSLEAAVNMKGAFNDISIKTERNVPIEAILSQVDSILKPYGGLISFAREDQLSNFFVSNELKQLEGMGSLAPVIFLSVAAFLINVVMSRQIATQREQIGMLKAVGYSNKEVSLHYLKMVLVITVLGSIIGLSLGAWMGSGMTQMYTQFFHFPILKYSFSLEVMILAVFSCTLAAVIGTLFAINKAAKLPPAEAMHPESPAIFKVGLLERIGADQYLSFTSRIIMRQIERRPVRTVMSSVGIAFALSILVFSFFMEDSMEYLMDVQYGITQREDVSIGFVEPKAAKALEEIKTIPGVLMVEPLRNVPVYFKNKHFKKRGSIMGLVSNPLLRRVIDENLAAVTMPNEGIVLNKTLAGILQLKVGDTVEVEILEDKRQTLTISVAAITQEFIGLGAFMNIHQLNKVLDSTPKITGASLLVDQNHSALLYKKLKAIPAIVGLNITSVLRQIFEDIMAENLLKMVATNVIFASFISFGIIYNTARITISERGRELASLRVLGLTRAEVAYILFGELGLITLLSLPIGLFLGYSMSVGMTESMDSELFRIPVYIKNSTYGYAVLIVLLSAIVSFYLVWRQVDSIDLVSAQKGVE